MVGCYATIIVLFVLFVCPLVCKLCSQLHFRPNVFLLNSIKDMTVGLRQANHFTSDFSQKSDEQTALYNTFYISHFA